MIQQSAFGPVRGYRFLCNSRCLRSPTPSRFAKPHGDVWTASTLSLISGCCPHFVSSVSGWRSPCGESSDLTLGGRRSRCYPGCVTTSRPPAQTTAPRRPRRPRGAVRAGLIAAGLELARTGGPDAVALREATRVVGVVPNAAYRHFANRDELLTEVCTAAMNELSSRVAAAVASVDGEYGDPRAARERLAAIGTAYLEFAHDEPGLFATAFGVPNLHSYSTFPYAERTAHDQMRAALDELVDAGVLDAQRRTDIEFPIWSTVHGLAVLLEQGPLRDVPDKGRRGLMDRILVFIGEGLSPA